MAVSRIMCYQIKRLYLENKRYYLRLFQFSLLYLKAFFSYGALYTVNIISS